MATPQGYSRSQIWLHWIVVVLIAVQFLFNDGIAHAWWGVMKRGEAASYTAMVLVHILAGAAIFVFVVWRLALRGTRGAPPPPAGGSPLQNLAAGLVHVALYTVLVLMFASGLVAWFGQTHLAGEAHELLKLLLLGLIGIHVLAALYHQYVLGDNLIGRMMRAER